MPNKINISAGKLRATFLPMGVWCLWSFFVLSALYAFLANTSKPIDLIIFATVVSLFALWLPVNRIVIDKYDGVITITSRRLFSKVVTIKLISTLKEVDVCRGRGGEGVWFLTLRFRDENILLIAPDILPSHTKNMLKQKAIIEQFLSNSN
jgi:hypothetical protein